MSMMRCSGCDGIIDTDYDLDGLWEETAPHRWFCTACVENKNEEMLLILKKQEPDRYKELTDE